MSNFNSNPLNRNIEKRKQENYRLTYDLPFQQLETSTPNTVDTQNKSLSQIKILIIEDNILNQKLIHNIFVNHKIQHTISENGKLGVEEFQKNHYDIILMDLQMPEMDGIQATQYIRETLKSDIPILAVTAHSMMGEKEKCIAIGMNDYLSKPYDIKVLIKKIKTILNIEDNNLYQYVDMEHLKSLVGDELSDIKEILKEFLTEVMSSYSSLNTYYKERNMYLSKDILNKLNVSNHIIGFQSERLNNLMLQENEAIFFENLPHYFNELTEVESEVRSIVLNMIP